MVARAEMRAGEKAGGRAVEATVVVGRAAVMVVVVRAVVRAVARAEEGMAVEARGLEAAQRRCRKRKDPPYRSPRGLSR